MLSKAYEESGIAFRDGKAIMKIAPGVAGEICLDQNILLQPTEEAIKNLAKSFDDLGLDVTIYDYDDISTEDDILEARNKRKKKICRMFTHIDFTVFPPQRKYIYAYLEGPLDIADEDFKIMFLYLACVIVTIGALVFFGMITGGMSVLATIAIFTAVAGTCITAVVKIEDSITKRAKVTTESGA